MTSHQEALRFAEPIRARDKNALLALLASGADPNAQTHNGNAALHYNVLFGSAALIPTLRGAGADPNLQNIQGHTPLHLAALSEDNESRQLLMQAGAEESISDAHGFTAPELGALVRAIGAARSGDKTTFLGLLRQYPRFVNAAFRLHVPERLNLNGTLLHLMINEKRAAPVKLLLGEGANTEIVFNAESEYASTALGVAAAIGNKAIVQALLDSGAIVDPEVGRPLHRAAAENKPLIVELLLEHGADPNRTDARGLTPLWNAAFFGRKCARVLELLLQYGANPDLTAKGQKRPVRIVADNRYFEGIRVFQRYGSHETDGLPQNEILGTLRWTMQQKNAERFRVLVAEPPVRAVLARHGRDLLAKAIAAGQTDIVRVLLAAGVPPGESVLEFGLTPLQLIKPDAAVSAEVETLWRAAAADDRATVIRMVTEAPSLANAIGSLWIEHRGKQLGVVGTLVHLAVQIGDPGLLDWLLRNGADPSGQSEHREVIEKSPLELATDLDEKEMVEILKAHGAKERT